MTIEQRQAQEAEQRRMQARIDRKAEQDRRDASAKAHAAAHAAALTDEEKAAERADFKRVVGDIKPQDRRRTMTTRRAVRNDYGLPGPKSPPRAMVLAAKAERARRMACHGNWHDCVAEHSGEVR